MIDKNKLLNYLETLRNNVNDFRELHFLCVNLAIREIIKDVESGRFDVEEMLNDIH